MRKRLEQVRQALDADDDDEPMDAVVRRFWSRTKAPRPVATRTPESPSQARQARYDSSSTSRCARQARGSRRTHAVSAPLGNPLMQREREGEAIMGVPRSYRTIEEFEREELRPSNKAGFSLDDLMQETMLHESDLLFDDQHDEYEPDEDDED